MKYLFSACLLLSLVVLGNFSASAQETQERVVDEVVAQVNDGVITLSRVKREAKAIVDTEVQGGKTREAAQKAIDEKQGELIANLINEELMVQKAKELGLDKEVDESVNMRFAQIMKQYNLKTLDASLRRNGENRCRSAGDPRALAQTGDARPCSSEGSPVEGLLGRQRKGPEGLLRKEQSAVYKAGDDLDERDLSQLAGRDEAAVKEKAKELLAKLRSGADFNKMVAENSTVPMGENQRKGRQNERKGP